MPLVSGFRLRSAIVAGVLAGIVFMIVEMILVSALGGSPGWAVRSLAALVMGKDVLTSPTVDVGMVVVALVIHFIRSIPSAIVVALIVHKRPLVQAVPLGALVGAVLYGFIYVFYGAVGPWSQSPTQNASLSIAVLLTTYIVFGMSAAVFYKLLAGRAASSS
jgi:hypothetical protein